MTETEAGTGLSPEVLDAILALPGPDVVVVTDAELRIEAASAGASALTDRSADALRGLSLIAGFGSASLDEVARQALDAGSPGAGEATVGGVGGRQFEISAAPLPSGELLLWLHEITAARRAAQARRDVVANISHELRTPLASIKLLAETLAVGAADQETGREFAVQIQREVDHLAQLVDELLELSMIESGELKLSIAPVAPRRILAEVGERIGPIAARREVRVRTVEPAGHRGGEVLAAADFERLSQALLNLAHNAVKYSHRGGEVRLGWDPVDGRVRFWVSDDGVGIPLAHRDRIYERFYKVDRARARAERDETARDLGGASAGLGLAIVRHIAGAHDGTTGFESEEGVGSTFWVEVARAI